MELDPGGTPLILADGRELTAEYAPADSMPGTIRLRLANASTGEVLEGAIRADPWTSTAFPVHEWRVARALVICGARSIVVVDLETLTFRSSVRLEYEEAETLDRPWFVEVPSQQVLVVATERRVWCVDDRLATRWMWPCRLVAVHRWLSGPPSFDGHRLHVPVRNLSRETPTSLSLEDGLEG